MNQGFGIVLPLIFFFLIDVTLFANSLRQGEYKTKVFTKLTACTMVAQGCTAVAYASEYQLVSLSLTMEYWVYFISFCCATMASYIWFEYLMLAEKGTKKYVLGKRKALLLIPIVLVILLGIPSQRTHWIFYIAPDGTYEWGSMYILQFIGVGYYLAAAVLVVCQVRDKKAMARILGKLFYYLLPSIIGAIINTKVLRGGYTQIGASYAVFLLYLEQYITEVNKNRRLQNIERVSKNLETVNSNLIDQMSIIGGLTNAYFSVYAVDLDTGRCKAIKVIDFFKGIVKGCHSTAIVTKAFLATCVMPEDKEKMREFTDWRTLPERLSETNSIVQEFHGKISPWEWCRVSWVVSSRDENKRARNVLFTVEDVTESVKERIRYEEEREQGRKALEASQAAAEAANKAKTNFLFNMSHDIRTPMNAIIGYADLMEKHFGEEQRCKEYLDKIKKSSSFLLSLVNNVLEMARIESGKMVLEESVCNVSDLMDQITSVYSELMRQKRLTFTTRIQVQSKYYYGDMVKISEIFLNLISNAYKYTEKGGWVSVTTCELPCKRPGYLVLQTKVADSGIGMSKEFLQKIFDEFSREHTSTENKIEGTGLGMAIVKKLVDFMGGTIQVESELKKGTTFTVTIPHRIANAQDMKANDAVCVDPSKFIGKRILLVEDNDLNREIATEMLCEYGFVVESAEDGLVGIDMLTTAEDDYYDLILMDVQMPRLNGYETTKIIRGMEDQKKATIPIIAMTANAFEEDRKNALAAGMNGHLSKPIELEKLLEAIAAVL